MAALVVGAFIAANEETRISSDGVLAEHSRNAAEAAAEGGVSAWPASEFDSLAAGERLTRVRTLEGIQSTTTLVRLDSSLFWLFGEAVTAVRSASGAPSIQRRIGLLLRRVSDSTGHPSLLRLEERAWSELF